MKVIFIGCGYLGMNLSAQLREAATVQTIGLPGPYAPYCADFLAVDAFDERDLDRVEGIGEKKLEELLPLITVS